ncbi:hypothetical protein C5S39_01315 [Candidatus Methanophagaceae archaeon]|nr:hypothetical protein C5S39_01315 [Methanophagales archaeon]
MKREKMKREKERITLSLVVLTVLFGLILTVQADTTPTITFESPTPADGATVDLDHINVTASVTTSSNVSDVLRNWNGENSTMEHISSGTWSLPMTDLTNGDYTFKTYANDTEGNMGESETRTVTVNVTGGSYTIQLPELYSIIALPRDDFSVANASTLATKIGDNCTGIVKWDSETQKYISYVPGVPVNNFAVTDGEGYFVNVDNPTSVVFTGAGFESPCTVSLATDYNILSLPVNDPSVVNASTLATEIGDKCTGIVKWDSATQKYISYVPGVPVNNFAVTGGEGYFVKVDNPTSVVFTGEAWSN